MPSATRILLIEDDRPFREMVVAMMVPAGYEVTAAKNGHEATQLLKEQSFDLVVTDILMPDKEGIETIIEIRRDRPTLPILAMSGGGRTGRGTDLLEMARRFGAERTLAKPFTVQQLLDCIAECLCRR